MVKLSRSNAYIGFYDTETKREEFGSCYLGAEKIVKNTRVIFKAYQLDTEFPDFYDGLPISWIITEFDVSETDSQVEEFYLDVQNPFSVHHSNDPFLERFQVVPTFVDEGIVEFYGCLKFDEANYHKFLDSFKVILMIMY